MKWSEAFGTRMLAAIALVPAFLALSLFVEGGSWLWLVAAIAFPPLALVLGMVLFGGEKPPRRSQ
ncbi:MAG TPA: hypothetical protein VFF32_05880 [Dermatophilaceae bacterium]|nr:hypothetical protein [Dermatophilaceae bacterium]